MNAYISIYIKHFIKCQLRWWHCLLLLVNELINLVNQVIYIRNKDHSSYILSINNVTIFVVACPVSLTDVSPQPPSVVIVSKKRFISYWVLIKTVQAVG